VEQIAPSKVTPEEDALRADPLAVAERTRQTLKEKTNQYRRSSLGQFFTPPVIAQYMASMSTVARDSIRLVDAGAGAGALTAAWVAQVCSRELRPREVSLLAVEIDEGLRPQLEQTLRACESTCTAAGIRCRWEVRLQDFIATAVHSLDADLFRADLGRFDVAILNPPYKKLRSDSTARALLHRVGIETSNLYTAFVSLALSLLDDGGELIAITPRSFCNGPYFRPFREHLLRHSSLTHVHLFESRDRAFSDDEVLQENVIIRAIRGVKQASRVLISQSHSPEDPWILRNSVPFDYVLKRGDPHKFFHLVADKDGHAIARIIESLPCTLSDVGLTVSTGRVVDFRARQWLRMQPSANTVPLIYPAHFHEGVVRWPKSKGKKANAIVLDEQNASLMVPAGPYALVRRFSSKEERRRVVAALYDPSPLSYTLIGFENHINYFHNEGKPLEPLLARGLVAFLNSTLVDVYFRQFNGHTQVNAHDLRALRYPTRNALIILGRRLGQRLPEQDALDVLVEEVVSSDEGEHSKAANRRSPTDPSGPRVTQSAV
jgi:adenine-specific DNA-methyltransferase